MEFLGARVSQVVLAAARRGSGRGRIRAPGVPRSGSTARGQVKSARQAYGCFQTDGHLSPAGDLWTPHRHLAGSLTNGDLRAAGPSQGILSAGSFDTDMAVRLVGWDVAAGGEGRSDGHGVPSRSSAWPSTKCPSRARLRGRPDGGAQSGGPPQRLILTQLHSDGGYCSPCRAHGRLGPRTP